MARIFVVISTKRSGEGVELKTLQEQLVCDNEDCLFDQHNISANQISGGFTRDAWNGAVVRDGKEFCCEKCYLTTPEAKARMELATSS